MSRHIYALTTILTVTLLAGVPAASANVFDPTPGTTALEFVAVGDPGNPADPFTGEGTVDYEYRMSRYEVTNTQYAEFLNAVAASDPFDLYNPDMAGPYGGIGRSGAPGSYVYTVQEGRENTPVTFVSIFDAMRFVNWLHNGQGSGDTESGVYELIDADTVVGGRADDAEYFIPSVAEWYKAAYYQPAGAGGDADGYWLFPTASNTLAGNDELDGANYFDGGFFNGIPFEQGPLSPVGWYTEAASYFGTFDQGGNVSEWLEDQVFGANYGIRGGSWQWTPSLLESVSQASASGTYEEISHGFRVGAAPATTTSVGDRTPELQDAGVNVFPNPFNPQTTVAFTVPQAGQVSVQVFDMRGRLVDTLVRGSHDAGEHRVSWDGRDASGRSVGAGVYLVWVVTPTSSTTERAMLVK
jgi:formylglycine-generating enzyme required for sulfatase activity